jgi:hypothetical protein
VSDQSGRRGLVQTSYAEAHVVGHIRAVVVVARSVNASSMAQLLAASAADRAHERPRRGQPYKIPDERFLNAGSENEPRKRDPLLHCPQRVQYMPVSHPIRVAGKIPPGFRVIPAGHHLKTNHLDGSPPPDKCIDPDWLMKQIQRTLRRK